MQIFITILFLLLFHVINPCMANDCDTIHGKIVNCFDEAGRKQGYWIEFRWVNISAGDKDMFNLRTDSMRIRGEEGMYQNNKKWGKWLIWADNWHQMFISKVITYLENGSQKIRDYNPNTKIYYNEDSSIVDGQIFHKKDTLQLSCNNRLCKITLDKKLVLPAFENDYYRLDFELSRIISGEYDRTIQSLKVKRKKI
jgi:hypothetical protein